MNKSIVYDRVFLHISEMKKAGDKYVFLEKDEHGSLLGDIRVEAAKILIKQKRVGTIITVGGPTLDRKESKAKLVAKMIPNGVKVVALDSQPNTGGNLKAIMDYLSNEKVGINAFLTNYYHIPRLLKLILQNGTSVIAGGSMLVPLCAEAVLLTDSETWAEKIREWYSDKFMLKRIISEIQGLSHLEQNKYSSYRKK